MGSAEVRFKVAITGAKQAQQDLRDTADAVRDVGRAQIDDGRSSHQRGVDAYFGRTSRGAKQATEATRDLTKSTLELDDSAKTFAASLIGTINPQMGQMTSLLADGVKGAGGLSAGLLGVVGAGAAIGAIVMIVQHLSQETEEARRRFISLMDTMAQQRQAGAESRASLGDQLASVGIAGAEAAAQAQRDVAEMMQGGIGEPVAEFAAVAAAKASNLGLGIPLNRAGLRERLAAGYLASGKTASLSGDDAEDQKLLEQLLAMGGTDQAQQFLSAYVGSVGDTARANAPRGEDLKRDPLDAILKAMQRENSLSDGDMQRIRAAVVASRSNFAGQRGRPILGDEVIREVFSDRFSWKDNYLDIPYGALLGSMDSADPSSILDFMGIPKGQQAGFNATTYRAVRNETPEDASRTVGELLRLAAQAAAQAEQSGASGAQGQVTINIDRSETTNVATQYRLQELPGPTPPAIPDDLVPVE